MPTGRPLLKRVVPPILILALASGGAALLFATKTPVLPPQPQEKVWVVTTQPAVIGRHRPTITLFGRLEAAQATHLTSTFSTEVMEILCQEGDRVAKGQRLVQLDDRDARLRVEQRRAELAEIQALLQSEDTRYENDLAILKDEERLLALAQQEVARAQRLKQDKLAAQSHLDEAQQVKLRQEIAVTQRRQAVQDHPARQARLQAQAEKAEALLALARLEVQRSVISAPFDARITAVPTSPGNLTRPGDVLVELYALASREVRAQIPTSHLPQVTATLDQGIPLEARALLDDRPPLTLRLTRLSGEIKAGRGGRDGLFTLQTPADELAVGSTLKLQLWLPEVAQSLAIPREALYGNDRIYTIHDGRLMGHRVRRLGSVTADTGPEHLLVDSDSIAAGDAIVITQLPNAVDGLRVRPQTP